MTKPVTEFYFALPEQARHRAWQALLLMLLMVPLILGAWIVSQKYTRVAERLDQLAQRQARMLGIEASAEQIQQAAAVAGLRLSALAVPGAREGGAAGTDFQQKIRAAFESSKLVVVSIQLAPPKTEETYERIAVNLRVEGDWVSLQNALAVLAVMSPVVSLDSAMIQGFPQGQSKRDVRVICQFGFSVLRVKG